MRCHRAVVKTFAVEFFQVRCFDDALPPRDAIMRYASPLPNPAPREQSMTMPVTRHWTTAAVRELTQEDRPWPRYELLDGELLVTPAPRGPHQTAAWEICRLLDDYVSSRRLGVTLMSPADIELRKGTIMQPDVFVAPRGISPAGRVPEWSDITALLLAVEVLSPSTLRNDRVVKRDFYLANNVAEYWVVDVDARVIERWRPTQETPDLRREILEWSPRSGDPLVIDVAALFSRISEKWAALSRVHQDLGGFQPESGARPNDR